MSKIIHAGYGLLPIASPVGGRRAELLQRFLPPHCRVDFAQARMAGVPVRVDLRIRTQRFLYYWSGAMSRHYRRSPLATFLQAVVRDDCEPVFVDIGANLGFYTLIARRLGYRSIAFEPQPMLATFLRSNPTAFGEEIFDVALSDKEGTAEFAVDDRRDVGAGSLVGVPPNARVFPVAVRQADAVLVPLLVDAPCTVLKVDVEGNEDRTIAGLAHVLRLPAVAVWCEVRGRGSGRAPNTDLEVVKMARDAGLSCWVPHRNSLRPWTPALNIGHVVYDIVLLSEEVRARLGLPAE